MNNPLLPSVVDPQQLADNLDLAGLCIVDLCKPETSAYGHIPGAIHLAYADIVTQRPPVMGLLPDAAGLRQAVVEGALLRLRPKAMTVCVIVAGLLPILLGSGAGSGMVRRIAAPMVGGMITAPLVSLFVLPLLYFLWRKRRFSRP